MLGMIFFLFDKIKPSEIYDDPQLPSAHVGPTHVSIKTLVQTVLTDDLAW